MFHRQFEYLCDSFSPNDRENIKLRVADHLRGESVDDSKIMMWLCSAMAPLA